MIIIEGIPGCTPCKLLHNRLLNENIKHQYIIIDGIDGVCYPHVIVNGTELQPMTIDDYVRTIKEMI